MHRQVKHLRFFLIAALSCVASFSPLRAADPSAEEILANVRFNQTEHHRTLNGRLRSGENVTPFRLVLDGNEIAYEFSDGALVLKMGDKGAQLFEESKGGTQKITPAQFDTPVRGTDISYEDLALDFLYWPHAKIDGEEMKLAQSCWKLHLEPNARGDSQYRVVLLWVSKQSGALLQAEGYDASGKATKRFKVISGQRDPVTGGWMLKQMRIEKLQGLNSRDTTPSYLEIEK
jgi:hypothetical protein